MWKVHTDYAYTENIYFRALDFGVKDCAVVRLVMKRIINMARCSTNLQLGWYIVSQVYITYISHVYIIYISIRMDMYVHSVALPQLTIISGAVK